MSDDMGEIDPYIAVEVRAECGRRRWSTSELARRSGQAVPTVRRYYFSEERGITMASFVRVAEALEMTPSVLLRRAEKAREVAIHGLPNMMG